MREPLLLLLYWNHKAVKGSEGNGAEGKDMGRASRILVKFVGNSINHSQKRLHNATNAFMPNFCLNSARLQLILCNTIKICVSCPNDYIPPHR